MKYKVGDICKCKKRIYSFYGGKITRSKDTRVRITSIASMNPPIYRVYNMDFHRYEKIGEFYLEKDEILTRDFIISKITNV